MAYIFRDLSIFLPDLTVNSVHHPLFELISNYGGVFSRDESVYIKCSYKSEVSMIALPSASSNSTPPIQTPIDSSFTESHPRLLPVLV